MRSLTDPRKGLTTTFMAAIGAALFVLAGLPAAHGATDVAVAAPQGGSAPLAAASATVAVVDFAFEDGSTGTPVTTVAPGTTVTWVFEEGVHSATEGASAVVVSTGPAWDSGIITPDDSPNTWSKTFSSPGAFAYYCKVHPEVMKATLVVA